MALSRTANEPEVLEAIAEAPEGLTLNELAACLGLCTSHLSRHLAALERSRLVRFQAGRWVVGQTTASAARQQFLRSPWRTAPLLRAT